MPRYLRVIASVKDERGNTSRTLDVTHWNVRYIEVLESLWGDRLSLEFLSH